ncbi:hypothetical protein BJ875DRAFT_431265 [Amylocarpus encephaloides]|uniref:Uncharacterized protein n=1 Tax=Amylocarpus encephaloides TaxID=45428 RepID=A0A9P7YBG1_9HELO|nr:hypothetical protein BJ875DRAFT_431265 [Amylocarpus encephaloides]
MPTAGLLWVNSRITSTEFSKSDFNTWYNTEHVPDVIAASKTVKTAFRYNSQNPTDTHPYLALYFVGDVNFLGSKEYKVIPGTSEKYFPGKNCMEVGEFDTRWYEWVDGFEKKGVKSGQAPLIISAALTPKPGTDADFDAWYKDEHYRTLSEVPGYVRTRRYVLKNACNAASLENPRDPPRYLALHEFDAEVLPVEELQKTAQTEWAKRTMGGLVGEEVMVFKLAESWGGGEMEAKI